jgi:hypothetical protein
MNRVACVMSVLAMLAFAGPRAYACACADFPASEIESWSRAEFSRRFMSGRAAIFLGRVVEEGEPYPTEHGPSRVYTFEVQRYWKGAGAKRVYIHTAVFGAACGVTYEVSKTYLVIAQRDGGELFTSLCTHRLANRNREIFLRKLGEGKSPKL